MMSNSSSRQQLTFTLLKGSTRCMHAVEIDVALLRMNFGNRNKSESKEELINCVQDVPKR
jgi:hypothetical protein